MSLLPAVTSPDQNDSCNLNESTDLLEHKHKNIHCMIKKTHETSYKSSVQVGLAAARKETVSVLAVPRLLLMLTE